MKDASQDCVPPIKGSGVVSTTRKVLLRIKSLIVIAAQRSPDSVSHFTPSKRKRISSALRATLKTEPRLGHRSSSSGYVICRIVKNDGAE